MQFNILTIFPDYFSSVLQTSIIGRAVAERKIEVNVIDIRSFTTDEHRVTDDRPFGGGPGMVMKVEPIDLALQSLPHVNNAKKIVTSANGKIFTQQVAQGYSSLSQLTIVCGHYEGVDQRVADNLVDEEVRIGDYVLTGGEPAAAVILDAVSRLIAGVLGNKESNLAETHSVPGKGGYPQYTRPANYKNWQVPEVLMSGNHADIEKWRESKRSLHDNEE